MEGFEPITVTVRVASGDSCLVKNDRVLSRCWFYKGRACTIFNAVIVDHMKCQKCVEASS